MKGSHATSPVVASMAADMTQEGLQPNSAKMQCPEKLGFWDCAARSSEANSRLGRAKDWAYRPPVELFNRALKKRQRERANVMPFMAGAFVLDAKARAAIGGFLSRFGELLELHLGGETLYFFNGTNLVECLDEESTQRGEEGVLILEAIDESKIPTEPAVFKDRKTARVRNYVNDSGKEVIEQWAREAGITGLEIVALDPF